MEKAVVLLSGGLDSTTCLAYAQSQGYRCHALSFDYNQRHATELSAAVKIAASWKTPHLILPLALGQLKGSALTDATLPVPPHKADHIPLTYVPARNTIFLSFALAVAEVLDAKHIFIGVSSVDYSNYPDCRPEYIEAFQHLADLATKSSVEGNRIHLHTPLIHLSKAQTIGLGISLGVDFAMTVSCYQANGQGQACGTCDSCVLRKKGFLEAQIPDPTLYQGIPV